MSITCTAEFADWYEKASGNFKNEVLTDFVHRNPNFFGVLVAGTTAAHLDIAEVMWVDFQRLGSGFGTGTPKAVFEDVLRVLSVVPIERLAGFIPKPLIGRVIQGIQSTRYWKTLSGQACLPIALGQALQATGQRLLIKLDDVAKAMDRSISSFDTAGSSIGEARTALKALKAQFTEFGAGLASGWDDIALYAQGTEGVLMVPLKRTVVRTGKVLDKFHFIMVGHTKQGVKIFDRSGVYNSLDDLSRHYKSINPSEFYEVSQHPFFVIKNWVLDPALESFLTALGPFGAVVVRVGMTLAFNPEVPPATIDKAFQNFVAGRPPAIVQPTPVVPPTQPGTLMAVHTVKGPKIQYEDWLSNIAKKYYGDMLLWPILFDFNKGPDFSNPNKMYIGQRVKVPFIDKITPVERAAYRKRGYDWR